MSRQATRLDFFFLSELFFLLKVFRTRQILKTCRKHFIKIKKNPFERDISVWVNILQVVVSSGFLGEGARSDEFCPGSIQDCVIFPMFQRPA